MRQVTKFAAALAALSLTSACATAHPAMPAPATDTSRSSLCLVDGAIPVRAAPGAGVDDPGNHYDTDETTDALLEHNARYHAAC